jgi:hypothetical protein
MIDSGQFDRRRETRHQAAGQVEWNVTQLPDMHVGWLSDISESGVSFVTPRSLVPPAQETIEMAPLGLPTRVYRIVRETEYDGRNSLVACRHTSGRLEG